MMELKDVIHHLNERTKELNCLYAADEILRDFDSPAESIITQLTKIIPAGWQHVDICKALIIFDGKEFFTESFRRTELRQTASFSANGKAGEIRVYYVQPIRQEHRTIFLPEEHKLLTTLASKLGNYLEYKVLKDNLNHSASSNQISSAVSDNNLDQWLRNQALKPAEIEKITRVKVSFKKGETLCKQGALTNHIMLLSEGLTKAYLETPHDKNYIIKIIKPFDYIGISSLCGDKTFAFSVAALQPTTVYLTEKDVMLDILSANPAFSQAVMQWYSLNFRATFEKMSCLASKQSLGRMADTLLYLSGTIFGNDMIEACISRKDLADLAGLSTESAVRILSDLKNDKIIELNRSEIHILNKELLNTISITG
jgi:CRP/FNR family transcriptional regulator